MAVPRSADMRKEDYSEEALRAEGNRIDAQLELAAEPVLSFLHARGATVIQSLGSPLVRAKVAPKELPALESMPQVAMLLLDGGPGHHTSSTWFTTTRANSTRSFST
ncbi:MAG TPA: hypothetical protein VG963_00820, partial [Polyangiaceae bacterium]|nr:hypothetical protein [Polyangiaceae bacterium]